MSGRWGDRLYKIHNVHGQHASFLLWGHLHYMSIVVNEGRTRDVNRGTLLTAEPLPHSLVELAPQKLTNRRLRRQQHFNLAALQATLYS